MVGNLSVIIRLLRCSLSLALLSFSIIIIITHGCMQAPLSFLIFVVVSSCSFHLFKLQHSFILAQHTSPKQEVHTQNPQTNTTKTLSPPPTTPSISHFSTTSSSSTHDSAPENPSHSHPTDPSYPPTNQSSPLAPTPVQYSPS